MTPLGKLRDFIVLWCVRNKKLSPFCKIILQLFRIIIWKWWLITVKMPHFYPFNYVLLMMEAFCNLSPLLQKNKIKYLISITLHSNPTRSLIMNNLSMPSVSLEILFFVWPNVITILPTAWPLLLDFYSLHSHRELNKVIHCIKNC